MRLDDRMVQTVVGRQKGNALTGMVDENHATVVVGDQLLGAAMRTGGRFWIIHNKRISVLWDQWAAWF